MLTRRFPKPLGDPMSGSSRYPRAASCATHPKASGYAGCMPVAKHAYPAPARPLSNPASATFPVCAYDATVGATRCQQRVPASLPAASAFTKISELIGAPAYTVTHEVSGEHTDMPLYATNAKLADLDGNGTPDLVIVTNGGLKQVWTNDGAGSFSVKSDSIDNSLTASHSSTQCFNGGTLTLTQQSMCPSGIYSWSDIAYLSSLELGDLDGSQKPQKAHAARLAPRATCHNIRFARGSTQCHPLHIYR